MKNLLLLLTFVFWLYAADDDKEPIQSTYRQLVTHICTQDKESVEKLMVSIPRSILDEVLKITDGGETNRTLSDLAVMYWLTSLQNFCDPYNNDRINNIITGSIKCFAAGTAIVLDSTNWINWGIAAIFCTSGCIDFKSAYNNSGAGLRVATAYQIYKLVDI